MSGRAWWGVCTGRTVARLDAAVRALAVAEARIAVRRLAVGDWAGAHQAATRAEGEAVTAGWPAMVGAAIRLQGRAVELERREGERVARMEFDALTSWGLW